MGSNLGIGKTLMAIENILSFVDKNDYTYSLHDIAEGYEKRKEGYYNSYTMNVCLDNLESELNILYEQTNESTTNKLCKIHKEINNVKYFGLCQSTERILWNLVYDIARILEVDEDELGLRYMEE